MSRDKLSSDSILDATRDRAQFSRHGAALGAAGESSEGEASLFLANTGDSSVINPQEHGFGDIRVNVSWDNVAVQQSGFFGRLLKKATATGVDLDLGCLYELQDGTRGAIQALGNLHGSLNKAPFILLSQDERTGDRPGHDEYLRINGKHWPTIKKIIVYAYIYGGAAHWGRVRPIIDINVPGETPFVVTPGNHKSNLPLCAIAGLENVRNGIKLQNYTEYFAGHAEMDRAFGFGLSWTEGRK